MTSIHYLHRKNIAHRDIKPENLLMDSNFRIKLCDFGWSNWMSKKMVRKSVCGTYEYMPPEVVNEKPQTLKADLWSLGILLYEMLHGKAPFQANSLDQIKNKISKQQIYLNSKLRKETKDIVKLLLRKDSAQRCSAEEILGFMAHHFEIRQFEAKISEEDKFILFRNYYYNKFRITDHEVIRSKMVIDSLTMREKQENNKMPLKYHLQKGLNKRLVEAVDNLGETQQASASTTSTPTSTTTASSTRSADRAVTSCSRLSGRSATRKSSTKTATPTTSCSPSSRSASTRARTARESGLWRSKTPSTTGAWRRSWPTRPSCWRASCRRRF